MPSKKTVSSEVDANQQEVEKCNPNAYPITTGKEAAK